MRKHRRRNNGAVRFVGEMIGVTDVASAIAVGAMAICWLGMHASAKVIDDRRYIAQQRDTQRFIEYRVSKEMSKYNRH